MASGDDVRDIYNRLNEVGETLSAVKAIVEKNSDLADKFFDACMRRHQCIDDDIVEIKGWQKKCEGHKEGAERVVRSHALKVSLLTGAIYTLATIGILFVAWFELVKK